MGIEKVSTILKMADQARTSAIAFNCIDYTMIKSVITVAEETQKPAIIMLYPEHAKDKHYIDPEVFAKTVKALARNVSVPIGLHLDHCSDYNYIVKAIQNGFNSVMYDGSMLPLEENIKNTSEVVKIAHILGAEVEAELGHVGFAINKGDQNDVDRYTKPEIAAAFCKESGCDSVAVAIGSAHGFYTETPKLDIERLKEINAATDTPLVLHGGSGIPDDQLEVAFREGINKFNVGTEFFWLYYQTIKDYCLEGHEDFFDLPLVAEEKLKNYLRNKMKISKM